MRPVLARRLAVSAVLGSLFATTLRAEQLPIQRHGVAAGLAEETVTALLRDSRGYLWAGSLNGLSRFDGERFRVYGLGDGLYEGGVTTYLEVVTAQAAALNNERSAVDIRTRQMAASVNLIKALGGVWSSPDQPSTPSPGPAFP